MTPTVLLLTSTLTHAAPSGLTGQWESLSQGGNSKQTLTIEPDGTFVWSATLFPSDRVCELRGTVAHTEDGWQFGTQADRDAHHAAARAGADHDDDG